MRMASGGRDNAIKVWDRRSKTCQVMLEGHTNFVLGIDANTLASAGGDNTIKVWDLSTKTCQVTLEGHTNAVFALCRIDACEIVLVDQRVVKHQYLCTV